MSTKETNFSDSQLLRYRAEEQLKTNKTIGGKPGNEGDVKKLLYELQVHQIELEMQNETLRQANDIVENALKKYTMLYDFAPMGYFTLDSEGIICELKFTGAEFLGEKRFSLINSNFKQFISTDSKQVFDTFLKKVFKKISKESCTILLSYNDIPLCRVYMEGIVTGDDCQCLLSVTDISAFIN